MLHLKNYPTSDDSGKEGLLTIASGPVIIEDNKVLLDKHGDDTFWKFPGGTMSQTDSFRENAKREVKEELGMEVELADEEPFVMTLQKEKAGAPMTIILFHYYAKRLSEAMKPGEDVREYAWHDIDNLPADCAQNIKPAVEYFKNKMSLNAPDWKTYFETTEHHPVSPLLSRAVDFCLPGTALDMGPGALKDTKFLLSRGFQVTAVDKTPEILQYAEKIENEHLYPIISSFEDFDFPKDTYQLVNAQYSLPFITPDKFAQVFQKIKDALSPGGIFCGQFFGERDEWNILGGTMTFLKKEQVLELIHEFEPIEFKEIEKRRKTAAGNLKDWHVFDMILRKR